MINTYTWKTAGIVKETADTITIAFNTGNESFAYKPGQYIDITLTINGLPVTRSYSLSSSPAKDPHPSITIKRVSGGLMSGFLVDNADKINTWSITGPYGFFFPPASVYTSGHVVLLAGGSGITPLFSIAHSIVSSSMETRVTLIYSCRTPEDIIFKHSIDDLIAKYKGRVNVHYAFSRPGDSVDLQGVSLIRSRLNKLVTKKLINNAVGDPLNDVHYFICGPSGLMKMHKEMLETLQVLPDNIYLEWFQPDPSAAIAELPENAQEVLLHFFEQSNLLEVQAGKTILAAALDEKIPLPYSCKAGTCGRCTAKLVSGKVNMVSNYALRKGDLDEGLILLCQSYPVTSDVTVEIL